MLLAKPGLSPFAAKPLVERIFASSLAVCPIREIQQDAEKVRILYVHPFIPAKAGIQKYLRTLDSRLHGNDGKKQKILFRSLLGEASMLGKNSLEDLS